MAAKHANAADPARFAALEKRLGYQFGRGDLLKLAFTHTSARKRKLADYERLEFLGDRVLGLVIAETLLGRFPQENEGDLAKRLSQLVRKETLADVAAALKLGEFIDLSDAEHRAGGRQNASVLSDVCEALIAVLYIDGGLEAARAFIQAHWIKHIASPKQPPRDAKTALQEWTQGRSLGLPKYTVTGQSGPAHAPDFTVEVAVPGFDGLSATGSSRRAAEQAAAGQMQALIRSLSKKELTRRITDGQSQ